MTARRWRSLLLALGLVVFVAPRPRAAGLGDERLDTAWWDEVRHTLKGMEYEVTLQPTSVIPGRQGGLHAANRAQDLRAYFRDDGVEVMRRSGARPAWTLRMRLAEAGADLEGRVSPALHGSSVRYDRGVVDESWDNTPQGLRVRVGFPVPGAGRDEVVFEIAGGLEARPAAGAREVAFYAEGRPVLRLTSVGDGVRFEVRAGEIRVTSASAAGTERRKPVNSGVRGSRRSREDRRVLDLLLRGAGAGFVGQGISETPDWFVESNREAANLGAAVAAAGDVDGDGFSDLIVGAPSFDNGEFREGAALLFRGAPGGPSTQPAWRGEGDLVEAFFGASVAAAGDVNGDGFGDVIVGADNLADGQPGEGRAFVYLGSAEGLATTPAWTVDGEQDFARLGRSVSGAGDVDGDGFDDVIVGAPFFDVDLVDEGRVFVYGGSPSGLSTSPVWDSAGGLPGAQHGGAVAGAGDVNGDGYDDVVVGAPNWNNGQQAEGRSAVYLGSLSGLAVDPVWTREGETTNAQLGESVSSAGDVDGDGFADVVVGAPGNPAADAGRALVFLGSVSGPSLVEDWTASGGVTGAEFGKSVSTAGDVNGDGFADVVVGAPGFRDEQVREGRAFVYLGSATGPAMTPTWTADGEQERAAFGSAVAAAGDIDGDGFGDVVVGARRYDAPQPDEGRAFAFFGGPSGPSNQAAALIESNQVFAGGGISVSSAGDVNGDGFGDLIIGIPGLDGGFVDEGTAIVFHGAPDGLSAASEWTTSGGAQSVRLGVSVSPAGDVDGDGFGDVIVGASGYTNGQIGEGLALVFAGSPGGLADEPLWTFEPDTFGAAAGTSVAGAGDVNGDGFGDIVVGAPFEGEGGVAFAFHGSPSGPSPAAVWSVAGDLSAGELGGSVSSAGDVNGDGFADVAVAASRRGANLQGRVLVFLGSRSGLSEEPVWIVDGEQVAETVGQSIAGGADLNGDGFSDLVVGTSGFMSGTDAVGRVRAYPGSSAGLSITPFWTVEGDQGGASFGAAVGSADANGDGVDDVLVGSSTFGNGRAQLFLGSPVGPSLAADWTVETTSASAFLGSAIDGAGDVNADGFEDVIVGADLLSNGAEFFEGGAFLYLGNGVAGPARPVRQLRVDQAGAIPPGGKSDAADAFRLLLTGRSAAGRAGVRAEWEVKKVGDPFDAEGIGSATDFEDTGAPSAAGSLADLNVLVAGLDEGSFHRWRARVASDVPAFPRTPWLSLATSGRNDTKLRTAGELPQPDFGPIGPGTNELIFPDSEPLIFSWNRGAATSFRLEWSHNPYFVDRVEASDEIIASGEGDIQVFTPAPELWSGIRLLAQSPEIRRVPIFWRVIPTDGTPVAPEIRALRMETADPPVVEMPEDGAEFLAGQLPRIFWDPNHNERYRVVFSRSPSLAAPTVASGATFDLTGTDWQVTQDVWDGVQVLAAGTPDGVVHYSVFALDSIGRLTWSRVRSLRVLASAADSPASNAGRPALRDRRSGR